jgi:hypothetical protein
MIRSKIDNPWPVSVPTLGASVAAWAATTAYNVGDVRLHPSNFYMQVRVAGTSGGAAPTLQNFGTDIVDGGGTLRWRLASSLQGAALEITSGASEVHVMQSDFSGAQGRGAIVIDNDLATTAPFAISIMGGVVSQSVQSGIRAIAGNGLQVGGGIEFGQCVAAGCSSVELAATWGSDASIVNSYGLGGAANGVLISGGTNTTIANNNLFGYTTAVNVAAAVTKFSIVGNDVGTSTKFGVNTTGINVAAGASDNYVIFGNITTGATTGVTDAGTGTAKVVQTNEGDFTARKVISSAIGWLQTTPTTVAALPACNAGSKGARSFVTDNATALAFAAVITAGAAIQTPVYCDGTVWRQG